MNKKMLGICLAAAVISTGTLGGVVASEVADRSLLGVDAELETTGTTYGNVRLWTTLDKADANNAWASGAGYLALWIHEAQENMGSWEYVAQPSGVVWNSCEADFGYADVNNGWGTYRPYWYYDIPAWVFEEHSYMYVTIQYYKEIGTSYDSNASTFNGTYQSGWAINGVNVRFEKQADGRFRRFDNDTEYLDNSVMFVYREMKEYHTAGFGNYANSIDSHIAALAIEGLNTCSNSAVNGYEAIPYTGKNFLWTYDENSGAFNGWKDKHVTGAGIASETIHDYDPSLGADGSWTTASKDWTVNANEKLVAMSKLYMAAHPEVELPID